MLFAHDTEMNLRAAVALVNSLYSTPMDADALATPDALNDYFTEHNFTHAPAADQRLVEEVGALRRPLHELFIASRDEAAATVNAWLTEAGALPQLVRHDHLDWHVHAVPIGSDVADQIRVEAAMGMVDVIRADEMQRLSVCADEHCEGIVLDLSRNRSRRFCSTACGNRAAVTAYRARRSDEG